MKGVVIAGGYGTRLRPLTPTLDKHAIPIYDRPMFYYPTKTLIDSGVKEICFVLGRNAQQIIDLLRDLEEFKNLDYQVAIQDKPSGISGALRHAKTFVGNDNLCMILGDTNTDAIFSEDIKHFDKGALVFIKKMDNPNMWSVPEFDENKKIIKIHEHPDRYVSDYAITGIGLYDNTVFDKIDRLKPSKRGELELGDLNNQYIDEGTLKWKQFEGYWKDTGTFDFVLDAANYWKNKKKNSG